MSVSMMEIRDVAMIESDGLMTVYVRMRFDCWAVVRMLMMLVVEVRMVMLEPRMGMKVAVPFPNKQQNTGDHYEYPDQLWHVRNHAENWNRQRRAQKRRGRKPGGFTRSSEVAERYHHAHKAHAMPQAPQRE
jgi:hypothetical protein